MERDRQFHCFLTFQGCHGRVLKFIHFMKMLTHMSISPIQFKDLSPSLPFQDSGLVHAHWDLHGEQHRAALTWAFTFALFLSAGLVSFGMIGIKGKRFI